MRRFIFLAFIFLLPTLVFADYTATIDEDLDYYGSFGDMTFGSGTSFTWTFNSSASDDPVITFGDNSVAVSADVSADTLSVSGTGTSIFQEGVTINEGSNDSDFRVESDNQVSALLVDASTDKTTIYNLIETADSTW